MTLDSSLSREELHAIAVDAYLYFYPLVLMETTRLASTQWEEGERPGVGPMDVLAHTRSFATANAQIVVRPNFDTLYSLAWLDVSRGPFIIDLPEIGDRYYTFPSATCGLRSSPHPEHVRRVPAPCG